MKNIKVVLIGAGSSSFGRGTIADLLSSEELNKTNMTLSLVGINEQTLERMYRFAGILKEYYGASAKIEATTNRRDVFSGADYVITSVARKRNELWEQDFFMPYAYGFRHIFGECGGPGAAFHALRSFHLTIPICRDMEELCPDVLLLNFTNPESRVCMAVNKLTRIRSVGLCHGYISTEKAVAQVLGRSRADIDINIAGLNHFHWVVDICDPANGNDLYPELHQRMATSEWGFEPLVQRMYQVFGLLPFPAASHIGEFVSFAYDLCGPIWIDWKQKMVLQEERRFGIKLIEADEIQQVVEGKKTIAKELASPSGAYLAVPIICDIEFNRSRKEISVNIPNDGFAVSNLPEDAIVEIPARVDGQGLHPIKVGPLPEAIAAMCHKQVSMQKLLAEAYQERSKKLLLQALVIDPVVDNIAQAESMMNEMLRIESDFLPQFKD